MGTPPEEWSRRRRTFVEVVEDPSQRKKSNDNDPPKEKAFDRPKSTDPTEMYRAHSLPLRMTE
jgi:hypothetical protein